MVILVRPFRSGALYNFCYKAILLYSVSICITCMELENVLMWRRQVEWFLFRFLTCYISMVHDSNILLLYQYCAATSGRLEYVYYVSSKTLSR